MRQCTKCERHLPTTRFGTRSWVNDDGSKTTRPKSQCRDCVNESNLIRYHTNPKTKAAHKTASYRHRIKSYGLTIEDYDLMLSKQEGKCKSCGTETKLVIDHCHSSGNVRGLLCGSCNSALGHAKDDVSILEKLIEYLKSQNEN